MGWFVHTARRVTQFRQQSMIVVGGILTQHLTVPKIRRPFHGTVAGIVELQNVFVHVKWEPTGVGWRS